jgi:hypothetical protein
MKKKEDLQKSESELNPSEISSLEGVIQNLTKLLEENAITAQGLGQLDSLLILLLNFRTNYTRRVINLLKQDHMLD